jgi:hypothetical protein
LITATAGGVATDVVPALDVIRMLASDIGPRRPCSPAEARGHERLRAWLDERDVTTRTERFSAYSSLGYPFLTMLGAALVGGLLQTRRRRAGAALSQIALAALVAEGDLRHTPVSHLFARRDSANLVATIPASGQPLERVCLCAHVDTTRSGLMFHPRLIPWLPRLVHIPPVSAGLLAAGPFLRRIRGGRGARRAAIAGLLFGLAMLAERELRGEDVAGASDNASGCGVVAQLATELAENPLRHTEVHVLITGCEEVGLLGAQAYLRSHPDRATGTLFINFDTLGGDVPLTYILREGAPPARRASTRLIRLLDAIAARRPDLRLQPAPGTPGLPTDVTAALAHGHEGITLLAQGEEIPNYHWPTDTFDNLDPSGVARALEAGRELLAAIDRAPRERHGT